MNKHYRVMAQLTAIILFMALTASLTPSAVVGESNDSKFLEHWSSDKALTWSQETNGFRTGIIWDSRAPDSVAVVVLPINASRYNDYLVPASHKLPRFELHDVERAAIPPASGQRMDGALPARMPERDYPRFHDGIFSGHGVKYNYFILSTNIPVVLKEFAISQVYSVKKEGDYTLTVFPVIYKFETNREYLDRIDLPCVSKIVHLNSQ
jgi:hypothetical protein